MNYASASAVIRVCRFHAILALALLLPAAPARAQNPLMNCRDVVQQNPAKIFRSGIWRQWIYWMTPGRDAYAAVQRVVAEVNGARAAAGLPLLLSDPSYPIIVSVFDESNPRGANGSSAIASDMSNHELFFATFVDDTVGGNDVLFLADPIRSNDALTSVKLVPGVAGIFERSTVSEVHGDETDVRTAWNVSTGDGDTVRFSARYPNSAVFNATVSPASRRVFANCNLVAFSDLIYRKNPTQTFTLFDRSEANYIDLTQHEVDVRIRVRHHDRDIDQMFNDRGNVPLLLIDTDRVVRIESK